MQRMQKNERNSIWKRICNAISKVFNYKALNRKETGLYIVHNPTNTTVVLSDIRVEIQPRSVFDLEKAAKRDAIDGSLDLRQALRSKKLALVKYSVIQNNISPVVQQQPQVQIIERTIETEKLDEKRLGELIRSAIADEMRKNKQEKIQDTVKEAVSQGVQGLMASIREQINNIKIVPQHRTKERQDIDIDPAKLAEISQRNVEKISENIELGGTSKTKKINIINERNLSDLADELDS